MGKSLKALNLTPLESVGKSVTRSTNYFDLMMKGMESLPIKTSSSQIIRGARIFMWQRVALSMGGSFCLSLASTLFRCWIRHSRKIWQRGGLGIEIRKEVHMKQLYHGEN